MDGKITLQEENVGKQANEVNLNDQKIKRKPVRPKKKKLRDSILKQMEFYFSDAALSKDRYLANLSKNDPFIPIEVFLKFNKIRELTHDVIDISKALKHSQLLTLSDDRLKVKRCIPLLPYNSDERTVYVESIPSTAGLSWLTSVFQKFGPIAYISLPKFHNSNRIKGFAFVEYKSVEDANNCVKTFTDMGCKLPTNVSPDELGSVKTFEMPIEQPGLEKENVQHDHKNIVGPHKILAKRDNGHKNNDNNKRKPSKRNRKFETSEDQGGSKDADIESTSSKRQKTQSESDFERREQSKITGQKYSGDETLSDVPVFDEKKKNKPKMALDSTGMKRPKSRLSGDSLDSQDKLDEQNDLLHSKSKIQKLKKTKKDIKKEADKDDKSLTDKSSIIEMETVTGSEDEKEYDSSKPGPSNLEDPEDDKAKKATRNRTLKKRKKAKIHHETLPEGLELGLQILPKAEWKVLRNKYLTLQRKHYTEMKKALRSKGTNQRCEPEASNQASEREEQLEITHSTVSQYSKKCPEKTSGIVVAVTLPEPCIDIRGIKLSTKSNFHVMHVEIKEGQTCMYVRFDAPNYAQQFADSGIFSDARVLSGKEEDSHWEHIKAEWESRHNGGKRRMRGGDRLRLKITQAAAPAQAAPYSTPASQPAGKHLRFDD